MNVKNKIFITGPPASGKTTIIRKIVYEALERQLKVKGFFTPEIRKQDARIGFYVERIPDMKTVSLASRTAREPDLPRYGKYYLNPEAADFIYDILTEAIRDSDLIIIDEIGPMELYFPKARKAILHAVTSEKPVIGVVHRNLRTIDPGLYQYIQESIIYFVNKNNSEMILEKIKDFVAKIKSLE